MAISNKPFRRVTSLFKRKETPYQSWEEEDSLLDVSIGSPQTTSILQSTGQPSLDFTDSDAVIHPEVHGDISTPGREKLVECFYLGSYDMSGLAIKGRGCIDFPAGLIWEKTQMKEKHKPRRMNSWSPRQHHDSTFSSSSNLVVNASPRYVQLVAGNDELEVYDNSNCDLIVDFKYSTISFVGTHPKYTRLFAFIAQATGKPQVFCHAFKCEDKDSATQTAYGLSDVFQRKLLATKKTIKITSNVTVMQ